MLTEPAVTEVAAGSGLFSPTLFDGYRAFRALLRRAFRHTGMLRIDHVMGLTRQFWVPAGATACHGTVSSPSRERRGERVRGRRGRAGRVGVDGRHVQSLGDVVGGAGGEAAVAGPHAHEPEP